MASLPDVRTPVPGPRSRALAERLARVECPEVTCLSDAPLFWARASGAEIEDVDGNRLVDLLAGFGAVTLGHAHPEVADAIAAQAARLPHAMGDVYPAEAKVELLEALTAALPGDLGHAILSASGSDAVESALKTAQVATGRADVVAFEGAYHGLGIGALDATHRDHFREPFRERLAGRTHFVSWGDADAARRVLRERDAGAILFEPIQGRGGVRLPPPGFVAALREIADESGALLIADEVYTGAGRTGRFLACEHEGVLPDVVALGKGLGGGFPISACVGRADVMRRWPASSGEALHTFTHLGNPMGCASALAVLRVLQRDGLADRAAALGERTLQRLRAALHGHAGVRDVRGRGLMIGVEVDTPQRADAVVRGLLREGFITLPEGADANVIALTPPLTIPEDLLDLAVGRLAEHLK